MNVTFDISLYSFNFWAGGKAVASRMTIAELDTIQEWLEDSYGPEHTFEETEINDFFWFDDEIWLDILGLESDEFYKRPSATEIGLKYWPNMEAMEKEA